MYIYIYRLYGGIHLGIYIGRHARVCMCMQIECMYLSINMYVCR